MAKQTNGLPLDKFQKIKGELNAITNLFLFESIGIANWLCEVFLKFKSNYFEKLNIETNKVLQKKFNTVVANEIVSGMVWRRLRYSDLKYGSLLQNRDVFWAI